MRPGPDPRRRSASVSTSIVADPSGGPWDVSKSGSTTVEARAVTGAGRLNGGSADDQVRIGIRVTGTNDGSLHVDGGRLPEHRLRRTRSTSPMASRSRSSRERRPRPSRRRSRRPSRRPKPTPRPTPEADRRTDPRTRRKAPSPRVRPGPPRPTPSASAPAASASPDRERGPDIAAVRVPPRRRPRRTAAASWVAATTRTSRVRTSPCRGSTPASGSRTSCSRARTCSPRSPATSSGSCRG